MKHSRPGSLMAIVVAGVLAGASPALAQSNDGIAAAERPGDVVSPAPSTGVTLVLYGVQRMSGVPTEPVAPAPAPARNETAAAQAPSKMPSPLAGLILVMMLCGLLVLVRQRAAEPLARVVDRVRHESARLSIASSWIDRAWLNHQTRGDAN